MACVQDVVSDGALLFLTSPEDARMLSLLPVPW